jgi:hypothetical protein
MIRCSITAVIPPTPGLAFFAALVLFMMPAVAADGPVAQAMATARVASVTSTNLPLKSIGPGLFELGLVQLDKSRRTVSFPAVVNMKEGNLEYLVVAATGKTHESLLRTEAQPQDIQLALLLLGAKGAGTNALPEDPAKPLPGDRVEVQFSWKSDGQEIRRPADEFVLDVKAKAAMSPGGWIYNGSRLRDDGFAAQTDGSIISLITDPDALLNNPRPGREDDDNWKPREAGLPPVNSTVHVSIRLSH